MKSIIKKIAKYIVYGLIGLLTLSLIFFLMMQTPFFRNWIKNYISEEVNKTTGAELNIASIRGNLISNVVLIDVALNCEGDSLVYIPKVSADYQAHKIIRSKIDINSVVIHSPDIQLGKLQKVLQNQSTRPVNTDQVLKQDNINSKLDGQTEFAYDLRVGQIKVENGNINLPEFDAKVPNQINDLNLEAGLNYTGKKLDLDLNKFSLYTTDPDYSIEQLAFELRQRKEKYKLTNFLFKTTQNEISGKGEFEPQNYLGVEFISSPIYFPEFQHLLPETQPLINPEISLDLEYNQDSLNILLTASDNEQKVNLKLNATKIGDLLAGDINKNVEYELTGGLENIALNQWTGDSTADLFVNGNFRVKGAGREKNRMDVLFTGDLQDSRFLQYDISKLRLKGNYIKENVSGEIITAGEFGEAGITGELNNIWDSPQYNLDIFTRNFDVKYFTDIKEYPSDLNLKGAIRGEGLDPADVNVEGQLELSRSAIADYQIDTTFTNFRYKGDRLFLDTLQIRSGAADLGLAGNYSQKGNSDLKLNLDLKEIAAFEQYLPVDSIRAKGSITASLEGAIDSFAASVNLKMDSLQYEEYRVKSLNGEFTGHYHKQNIRGESYLNLNNAEASGIILDTIDLAVDYANQSADIDLSLRQDINRAHFIGSFSHDSIPEINIAELAVDYQEQKWRSSDKDAKIRLDGGKYRIDNFELIEKAQNRDQSINLDGVLRMQGKQDLDLQVANINTDYFNKVFDLPARIAGDLNMDLSLQGTATDPIINSRLAINKGRLNRFLYDSLSVYLNYNEEHVDLKILLRTNQSDSIKIAGNTTVDYSLFSQPGNLDRDTPFELGIATRSFPVSLINAIDLPVKNVSARAVCDVRMTGTFREPRLAGFFRVNRGQITAPQYGVDYENIDMKVSMTDKLIRLDTLKIRRDRGRIKMDGLAGFKNSIFSGNPDTIDFRFDARNFYITRHDDHEILVKGDGFLKGTPDKPEFGGKLTILRSSLDLLALAGEESQPGVTQKGVPLLVKASKTDSVQTDTIEVRQNPDFKIMDKNTPEFYKNSRGSFKVVIPRNTWIKSEYMRSELSGKLDLVKKSENIQIFGEVNIDRGYYDFIGKRFKIEEGRIAFTGNEEINPALNLSATYTFRTETREKKTLTLSISGKARQPEISFFMEGEKINEGDAVAYIMFGKSIGQLSAGRQEDLEATVEQESKTEMAKDLAANLVSAELTRLIGDQLNLDYVEIQTGAQWQTASLMIGKYITPDLYVSYQRGLGISGDVNEMAETVRLEYQLTKIIFLQLISHSEYSGGDVIFQFQRE
jgi:translocation and assembly module TamB